MVENSFERRNEHFFGNEILDVLDGDFYFNSEDNVSLDEWIKSGPNLEEFSPKIENLNDCSQGTSHSRSPLKEFLVFHDETSRFDVEYSEENSLTTEHSCQSSSSQESKNEPDQGTIKSLDLLTRHGQKLEAIFLDLPPEESSNLPPLENVTKYNQQFSELSLYNNESCDSQSFQRSQESNKLRKRRSRKQQFKCLEHDDMTFFDPPENLVLEDEDPIKVNTPVVIRRSPRIKLMREKKLCSEPKIK